MTVLKKMSNTAMFLLFVMLLLNSILVIAADDVDESTINEIDFGCISSYIVFSNGCAILISDAEIEAEKTVTIPIDIVFTIPADVELLNAGTIENNGTLIIESDGAVTNTGNIENNNRIVNNGIINCSTGNISGDPVENVLANYTGVTMGLVEFPTGLSATFGQTLSDVTIIGGIVPTGMTFMWKLSDDDVGDVGRQVHELILLWDNSTNYQPISQYVEITVDSPSNSGTVINDPPKQPSKPTPTPIIEPSDDGINKSNTIGPSGYESNQNNTLGPAVNGSDQINSTGPDGVGLNQNNTIGPGGDGLHQNNTAGPGELIETVDMIGPGILANTNDMLNSNGPEDFYVHADNTLYEKSSDELINNSNVATIQTTSGEPEASRVITYNTILWVLTVAVVIGCVVTFTLISRKREFL